MSQIEIDNSSIRTHAAGMNMLREVLESPLALGRPVIDKTHLMGHYDISINRIGRGPEGLTQTLLECGLVVAPDRRMVDIVVVR